MTTLIERIEQADRGIRPQVLETPLDVLLPRRVPDLRDGH